MLREQSQDDHVAVRVLSTKHHLKLPRKRLYRTLSIAKELRNQGKAFEWFTKNSIVIHVPTENPSQLKKTVFITGSLTCYKVRVDLWQWVNKGDFFYFEVIENNGRSLLFRLVEMDILYVDYLPSVSNYHSKLNDL